MRLIHCADLHLDARMTANLTAEKARERRRELLLTFVRLVTYASEHQVEAILISGDLFDTRKVSSGTRNAVLEAVSSHPEITFFYLKGNHDTDSFQLGWQQAPENLKLFGGRWVSYPLGEDGDIVVSGIELSKENEGKACLSLPFVSGKFHIVMLHGQAEETGKKEQAENIRLRDLRNRGIDYLALGHIHSYREGQLDSRGVWCYPGCLEGRGFDECGPHGFMLLEIDGKSGVWSRRFVPFALRTLHTVEADISGCKRTAQMEERIRGILDGKKIPNRDLVKLVLTGALSVECEKDLLYLEKSLEAEYYVIKIQDRTRMKADLGTYLLDGSLKGEFVRLVMGAEELSEEERGEIIRCGLQALSGEEVEV